MQIMKHNKVVMLKIQETFKKEIKEATYLYFRPLTYSVKLIRHFMSK